jgi:hypothetical protein
LAESKTAGAETKGGGAIPPMAIVIGIVLLAGVAGLYYLNRAAQAPPPPLPPLTGAAKEYVRSGFLPIGDVAMQAHESYLHQRVVDITGNIGNSGSRAIEVAEIYCVFYDAYNQVVLRERLPIVSRKMGGLAPGETKPFRLPFDSIPESWNQALPQIVIAQIAFQ